MARKSFKCTTVEYYEDTGKIKYMEFTENKIYKTVFVHENLTIYIFYFLPLSCGQL